MKLLLYKGLGVISKAIRLQTRSEYSHAAAMLDKDIVVDGVQYGRGTIWEAWHVGGPKRASNLWMGGGQVRRLSNPWIDHDLKTEIEVYTIDPPLNDAVAIRYLESQVGKEYDFRNVVRFMTRKAASDNDKLFCSEYFSTMSTKAGTKLLNLAPAQTAPCHLKWSPFAYYERTMRNGSLK